MVRVGPEQSGGCGPPLTGVVNAGDRSPFRGPVGEGELGHLGEPLGDSGRDPLSEVVEDALSDSSPSWMPEPASSHIS